MSSGCENDIMPSIVNITMRYLLNYVMKIKRNDFMPDSAQSLQWFINQ